MDNPFNSDYLFGLSELGDSKQAEATSRLAVEHRAWLDSIANSGTVHQIEAEYHDMDAEYHGAHIAALEAQLEELRRQADAQEQLNKRLAEEAVARSKDDKKYFWFGALVSLTVSMLVEHGPAFLTLLRQLFQT